MKYKLTWFREGNYHCVYSRWASSMNEMHRMLLNLDENIQYEIERNYGGIDYPEWQVTDITQVRRDME